MGGVKTIDTRAHGTQKTKTKACAHTKQKQKSARPSELETAHSHNETEHGARVSEPQHETETQDMSAGIRTPRSNTKQGMQTRERTARAHSKPHTHIKTGHDGSVRALSQNQDSHTTTDKTRKSKHRDKEGREGGEASQCRQDSPEGHKCPERGGRVEPGRRRQFRKPSRGPGRHRPNKNPGGWPGQGLTEQGACTWAEPAGQRA